MKVIIALGNPGKEYANTRHNAGWLFLDFWIKKQNLGSLSTEKKFKADVLRTQYKNQPLFLVKPHTFMNLSGETALAVLQYFKIQPETDLIIIHDDLDLDFGTIRIKKKGGHGGHNGLKSLFALLKTQIFPRLKLGIKNEQKNVMQTSDFVLSRFTEEEVEQFEKIFGEAGEKLEEIFDKK